MTTQIQNLTIALLFGNLLIGPQALAKKASCNKNIARSSVYFVPHIRDYCPSLTPCKAFREEVKDKGSGTLYGSKILNYRGKEVDIGDCRTAIGKRGTCLKPFISVAADPDYYRMGDIIEMKSMKGKVFTLPDGKTFIHPGYFIVEDIGSDIQGPSRFDFFTGSYSATDVRNPFGYEGEDNTIMTDRRQCENRKAFKVIRRGKGKDYNISLAMIETTLQGLNATHMLASQDGFTFKGIQ